MRKNSFLAAMVALLFAVSQAQAHFIWIAVQAGSEGKSEAHVYFAELAEPDDAKLLDNVKDTKAWTRVPGAEPTVLKLEKQEKDGDGSWVSLGVDNSVTAASAVCKYGVFERGTTKGLLQYYAKYLDSTSASYKALLRDEALPLDIVPEVAEGTSQKLTVLFQGKPAAGSEVLVRAPDGADQKLKTDAEGHATITLGQAGLYSIRAKWEVQEAGKEGDKEYNKIMNYTTLTLRTAAAK